MLQARHFRRISLRLSLLNNSIMILFAAAVSLPGQYLASVTHQGSFTLSLLLMTVVWYCTVLADSQFWAQLQPFGHL